MDRSPFSASDSVSEFDRQNVLHTDFAKSADDFSKSTTKTVDDVSKKSSKTVGSNKRYSAGVCYTYIRTVNVHPEPRLGSVPIGIRSVGSIVVPVSISEADGYIWACYVNTIGNKYYTALASSDGSDIFAE